MNTDRLFGKFFILLSVSVALSTPAAFADVAPLIDQAVLVELVTGGAAPDPDNPETPSSTPTTPSINASYVSSGGWATTGSGFIDAATFVFDFGCEFNWSTQHTTIVWKKWSEAPWPIEPD